MIFEKLFAEQFYNESNGLSTRSPSMVKPIHSQIAKIVEENSNYTTKSLVNGEYTFEGSYGSKKIDIAIFDNKKLIGAINFKSIRSEYNKNANNYYENMKGESDLFVEAGIPIFQIIFIPTKIKHKNSKGKVIFEEPSQKSKENYINFMTKKSKYWDLLTFIPYYFEVDYKNYTAKYCKDNYTSNLTTDIIKFIGGLK